MQSGPQNCFATNTFFFLYWLIDGCSPVKWTFFWLSGLKSDLETWLALSYAHMLFLTRKDPIFLNDDSFVPYIDIFPIEIGNNNTQTKSHN